LSDHRQAREGREGRHRQRDVREAGVVAQRLKRRRTLSEDPAEEHYSVKMAWSTKAFDVGF
jgi:hypothetical protein